MPDLLEEIDRFIGGKPAQPPAPSGNIAQDLDQFIGAEAIAEYDQAKKWVSGVAKANATSSYQTGGLKALSDDVPEKTPAFFKDQFKKVPFAAFADQYKQEVKHHNKALRLHDAVEEAVKAAARMFDEPEFTDGAPTNEFWKEFNERREGEGVAKNLRQRFPDMAPGHEVELTKDWHARVRRQSIQNKFDDAMERNKRSPSGKAIGMYWVNKLTPFAEWMPGQWDPNEKIKAKLTESGQRIESGIATKHDFDFVASAFQQARRTEEQGGTAHFADFLAGMPKILTELYVGGLLAEGAVTAAGLGKAYQALGAATQAGQKAPLLSTATLKGAGTAGLQEAIKTPFVPSMYAEAWKSGNAKAGRDPYDLRGLPAALGLGAIQMFAMGSTGTITSRPFQGAGIGQGIGRITSQGVSGPFQQQAIDAVTSLAEGEGIDTGYGTFGKFYRGESGQAWQQIAHDVAANAAFAGVHEVNKPMGVVEDFAGAVKKLRGKGYSEQATQERIRAAIDKTMETLATNPDTTPTEAVKQFQENLANAEAIFKEAGKARQQRGSMLSKEAPEAPRTVQEPTSDAGATGARPDTSTGQAQAGTGTSEPKPGFFRTSDGQEYADIPRMRAFAARGEAIRQSLPPVPEGHVRLWRGNRKEGDVGKNPQFTDSLEGIAMPFQEGYGGKLTYVDVPTDVAAKHKSTLSPNEYKLPAEFAPKAKVVSEPTKAPEPAPAAKPVEGGPEIPPVFRRMLAEQPEQLKKLADGGNVYAKAVLAEAAQPVERRQDAARRRAVAEMSPEEMRKTLLTSAVVDLPNRRAFDEAGPAKAVAMSDADGLKALNDTMGYEAGDALLRAKAKALKEAGLDAYHEKGDEFLYRGDSPEEVKSKLERARSILRGKTITVTLPDGTVKRFRGADFSYGAANELTGAEAGLKAHKAEREARGERARGELRGIVEVGAERPTQGSEAGGRAPRGDDGPTQTTRPAVEMPSPAEWEGMSRKEAAAVAEKAGVKVKKGMSKDAMLEAIGEKLAGEEGTRETGNVLPDAQERQLVEAKLPKGEEEALRAMASGSTRAAAKRLLVSHQTIKNRADAAAKKLGAESAEAWLGQEAGARIERAQERAAEAGEKGVLFSGFPLKLTMLDGFFKHGWSLKGAVKKWFTSAGSLPKEVFEEHGKALGTIAAHVEDVRNAEKDMRRAVKYDTLAPADVKRMDDALHGDARALAAQTPEVQAVITKMRREVDLLATKLIQEGAIAGPLVATVQANMGVYLHRSYQVFSDPAWASKVSEPVKNRFQSWMDAELRAAGHTPLPGEVEGIMQKLLHNGTASENPIAFLSKSKLGSKDLSILTKRKDVPPELRALWGEHEDPLVNYAHSVGKMSSMLANHIFLTKVRQMGMGKYLFDKPTPEAHMLIADENTKSMEPLAGKYTTPEIKQAFDEIYNPKESNTLMKLWMGYLGAAKVSKTVLSPVGTMKNNIGNIGFAMMNGHWRIHKMPGAIKALLSDTQAGRDYWRRATELRLTTDGVNAGEFSDVAKTILGRREDAPFTSRGVLTDRSLARAATHGFDAVSKFYQVQDTVYKLFAFENEKAQYAKANPSWTPEQVEQHASKIVRDTYPTYSMTPRVTKAIGRVPVIGSFVSFSSEVVRTTYNSMKLGMQEMANPATRAIGARRLAGSIMALTASTALGMATRAMFGVDKDDEQAMRRLMPEWAQNSPLLHIGTNDKGDRRYIDMGTIDPHAYLAKPVMAMLQGKDPKEAILDALSSLADPYVSEEIGATPVLDIARNKKKAGGEVYNPQAPGLDIAKDMASHVGKAVTPGAYDTGRRIYMAATGEAEKKSGRQYDLGEELMAVARPQSLEVKQSLGFKARDFEKAEQQAVKLLMSTVRQKGMVSDAEIVASYQKMETARRKLFDDMRQDVLAAQKLGMTDQEVRASLKEHGVAADDIAALMGGTYRPHQTTKLAGLETGESRRRLDVIRAAAKQ